MDIDTAINEMLGAIGGANDEIDAIVQAEQFAWIVSNNDGSSIDIEADTRNDRLFIYADLGRPNPDKAAHIHRTMLQYNLLWQDTGGLRMGLSGDGTQAILIGDTPLPEVSEVKLDEMLTNLTTLARAWGHFVANGSLVANAGGEAPADEMMIRV